MSRRREDAVIEQSDVITIGELARLSGVRYSTLKYYSELGLLPFAQNDVGLTRRYERAAALSSLQEIIALRASGKSIREIQAYYSNRETGRQSLSKKSGPVSSERGEDC
ncbi:MAG: MerR family transcriptional regulator [Oscillospiraceae bacterium]|nr:MerR family transcriptional regulator [Oscillospiraceae bacterium]